MAKLFFRYSSMGAGKSLDLIKTCYNYEERGKKVIIFTSIEDDRYGENVVKSRTGLQKDAIVVNNKFDMYNHIEKLSVKPDCVLVDEIQFFKKYHIYQLTDIVDKLNIPVIGYGLRSDFKLEPFEGSSYMLILADLIEELRTLCHKCDKKAILNIRLKDGKIVNRGKQIQIGGNETYISLCRKCYKKILENESK